MAAPAIGTGLPVYHFTDDDDDHDHDHDSDLWTEFAPPSPPPPPQLSFRKCVCVGGGGGGGIKNRLMQSLQSLSEIIENVTLQLTYTPTETAIIIAVNSCMFFEWFIRSHQTERTYILSKNNVGHFI